jgi:hypothetical protein
VFGIATCALKFWVFSFELEVDRKSLIGNGLRETIVVSSAWNWLALVGHFSLVVGEVWLDAWRCAVVLRRIAIQLKKRTGGNFFEFLVRQFALAGGTFSQANCALACGIWCQL